MVVKENEKDTELIVSLCKDIARHASQLEAEIEGVEQSTDRYMELKKLLVSYYLQGEDNLDTILDEIRKSISNACDFSGDKETNISIQKHIFCMFEYFLLLMKEANKN